MSLWNFFLRSPRPGYDWSVTLPTTATTNQFHKYLEGEPSVSCERTIDMFEDRIEELNGRIKELEAEIAGLKCDLHIVRFAFDKVNSEAERLRKALQHIAENRGNPGFIARAALSPSPAAEEADSMKLYREWYGSKPLHAALVEIGKDGLCNCNNGTTCPLGRRGSELRCKESELVSAGIKTRRLEAGSADYDRGVECDHE